MCVKRSIYYGGAVAQVAWIWRAPRSVTVLACLIPPFPHSHSDSGLHCHFSKPWCSQVARISRGASKPKCFFNSFQFYYQYSFHVNFEARVRTGRLVPLCNVALTSSGPSGPAPQAFSQSFLECQNHDISFQPHDHSPRRNLPRSTSNPHHTASRYHRIITSQHHRYPQQPTVVKERAPVAKRLKS